MTLFDNIRRHNLQKSISSYKVNSELVSIYIHVTVTYQNENSKTGGGGGCFIKLPPLRLVQRWEYEFACTSEKNKQTKQK